MNPPPIVVTSPWQPSSGHLASQREPVPYFAFIDYLFGAAVRSDLRREDGSPDAPHRPLFPFTWKG
jgi:hypothetical protein